MCSRHRAKKIRGLTPVLGGLLFCFLNRKGEVEKRFSSPGAKGRRRAGIAASQKVVGEGVESAQGAEKKEGFVGEKGNGRNI